MSSVILRVMFLKTEKSLQYVHLQTSKSQLWQIQDWVGFVSVNAFTLSFVKACKNAGFP